MEMKFGLHLKQKQQLVMTPKLQQALKLLQMPAIELQQMLIGNVQRLGIRGDMQQGDGVVLVLPVDGEHPGSPLIFADCVDKSVDPVELCA